MRGAMPAGKDSDRDAGREPDTILLIQNQDNSELLNCVQQFYSVLLATSHDDVTQLAQTSKAIVLDQSQLDSTDHSLCQRLINSEGLDEDMPILVVSPGNDLEDKLALYEMGFDDYLSSDSSPKEICARISKAIMHRVASEQLRDRLNLANQTAHSVMSDNSDLGLNIRFLLGVHHCDNLDQLGQLFFSSIDHYDISCSLQMRSSYEVKNMDANGMARDLESQLLSHMQNEGRYVVFGRRSIVNYGRSSLLVRNMPLDDERRYGAIKDNTFALVQGIDARIRALDEHHKLQEEKASLRKLSEDVKQVMQTIDDSYQQVMRDIVSAVEDMSEKIQSRIPGLILSEEQETFFESVADECVSKTNGVFNEGLKVDEVFNKLSRDMDHALELLDSVEEECVPTELLDVAEGSDGVELF